MFVVIKKYLKERLIPARVLLVAAKKAPSLNAGFECKININFTKRKHFDFFFFLFKRIELKSSKESHHNSRELKTIFLRYEKLDVILELIKNSCLLAS